MISTSSRRCAAGPRPRSQDLSELSSVDVIELDVTVTQTTSTCRDVVGERTGGKLDILINSAGVEGVRPLLDADIASAKQL